MGIDWNAPLEAYHPDGRVVAVKRREDSAFGYYCTDGSFDDFCGVWNADGSFQNAYTEWRIRNRTVSPDVVDRMVRLVRDLAKRADGYSSDAAAEVCAIAALLPPEPIDPDAALARKLCDESTFDLGDAPVVTNSKILELVKMAIRAGRESRRCD